MFMQQEYRLIYDPNDAKGRKLSIFILKIFTIYPYTNTICK